MRWKVFPLLACASLVSHGVSAQSSESSASGGQASDRSASASITSSASSGNSSQVSQTVFVTYSISNNQTISYSTTQPIQSQSAKSSASTSTTPKTLPLATATVAGGNAGSDPAVTAPQPGSGKAMGPNDDFISGASATTGLHSLLLVVPVLCAWWTS